MKTLGLLHPGQMGAAFGAQFVSGGARVLWCPHGRSDATRRRAEAAGLRAAELPELIGTSQVIVSLVPPAAAEESVDAVLRHGFTGVFVEANAIRPERLHRMRARLAAGGVLTIDACVIGSAPPAAIPTRFYLAGEEDACALVARLLPPDVVDSRFLGEQVGSASALKISQTITQKTTRIISALGHALAAQYGVGDHLGEVARSFTHPAADPGKYPELAQRAWRWAPEVEDAAAALGEAGLPPGVAAEAAQALGRWARFKDGEDCDIATVLGALHDEKQLPPPDQPDG